MTGSVAIGIDVGGTKIAGGLVDLSTGALTDRRIAPTRPERGGDAVLAETLAMAEALAGVAAERGTAVTGIGAGVAELVDLDGELRSSHLIAWEGLPVRERLSAIAPATIEADVRAAATAEARYGAGRAFDPFVYVSVGTGISSCLMQSGRPYAGARGNALVLATAPVTVPCDACGSWTRHVLEEYAAGPAIAQRYRQLSGRPAESAEAVAERVGADDLIASEVLATAGFALGNAIAWLINVLDPAAVIVGGGLGLSGGIYWERMTRAINANVWNAASRATPIMPAALGADAGVIGAAASTLERGDRGV